MWSVECGMWNDCRWQCGVRNVECGIIGDADEELFNEELRIQHSTFIIAALPQQFHTQHSTFHTQHSSLRLCRNNSTFNTQHSTFKYGKFSSNSGTP